MFLPVLRQPRRELQESCPEQREAVGDVREGKRSGREDNEFLVLRILPNLRGMVLD